MGEPVGIAVTNQTPTGITVTGERLPPLVPDVIGFGGYASAGKDESAAIVTREYGHRLLSFGTYVCALLTDLNCPIDMGDGTHEPARDVYDRLGYEGAKTVPAFRELLQNLGTAVNHRDPGFWARLVLHDRSDGERVVISGVRSKAQIAAVRDVAGLTVWVARPGVTALGGHENERVVGPEDFDVVLRNDGTLDHLRESMLSLLAARR